MPPDDTLDPQTGVPDAPAPQATPGASLDPAPAPAAPAAPAADAAPAPAATPAATAPAAEPPRDPTTFETFDKAAADKAASTKAAAAEPKPADPARPAGGAAPKAGPAKDAPAATADPAAEIKYEFKLPDTFKADDPRIADFTGVLREIKATPEVGQKLIDMHAAAMAEFAEQLAKDTLANQFSAFNKTRADWRTMMMADPELGGAGHQTALKAAARMRDKLVSSARPGTEQYKNDLQSFIDFDRATGASDHPALMRMLHNAARYLDEPQAAQVPVDIKPAKGNGRPPRGNMYTHPSSANMDR
jgi:hypothetical protein